MAYTAQSKSGFFAIELTSPELAFGNSIYAKVVSDIALKNTVNAAKKIMASSILSKIIKFPKNGSEKVTKKLGTILMAMLGLKLVEAVVDGIHTAPNKPYVPKIKGTTFSYTSSYKTSPGTEDEESFYRIHPYGNELVCEAGPLLPQYPDWGYVFLGFSELQYNTSFTLFLGIEDRLDTQIEENFNEVSVELLTENGWVATTVQSDSTFGLNISGIITFQIDQVVSNQNTIMPVGQYWIRLGGTQAMAESACLTMIGTNAAEVSRVIDSSNDRDNLENIAAGTIKNLSKTVSAITKVVQPFRSFGGEEPETQEGFYQAVSERIEHKDRGSSVADIQSLILSQFKEIYQANVVPARFREHATHLDQLDIALVPVIDPADSTDPYRPIAPANDLSEVMLLLENRVSPHLTLEVQHAKFEIITISLTATFQDPDQYFESIDQLNSDLKNFLSPWIEGNTMAYQREALYSIELVKFIRSRSYVTSFSKLAVYQGDTLVYGQNADHNAEATGNRPILPKDPLNILVSAKKHLINPALEIEAKLSSGENINELSDAKPSST